MATCKVAAFIVCVFHSAGAFVVPVSSPGVRLGMWTSRPQARSLATPGARPAPQLSTRMSGSALPRKGGSSQVMIMRALVVWDPECLYSCSVRCARGWKRLNILECACQNHLSALSLSANDGAAAEEPPKSSMLNALYK